MSAGYSCVWCSAMRVRVELQMPQVVVSESLPGGPRVLTHDELTAKVASLHSVGGVYELLSQVVERDNRPHCVERREP